jgi:F-type H+-transporting ATPase subunit epsilon
VRAQRASKGDGRSSFEGRLWRPPQDDGSLVLTVYAGGGSERIVVLGGFVEVSADGLTVLADVATSLEDIDQALIATHIKDLEERVTQMQPGSELDREVARLDHFRTLNQHLNGTAMH